MHRKAEQEQEKEDNGGSGEETIMEGVEKSKRCCMRREKRRERGEREPYSQRHVMVHRFCDGARKAAGGGQVKGGRREDDQHVGRSCCISVDLECLEKETGNPMEFIFLAVLENTWLIKVDEG